MRRQYALLRQSYPVQAHFAGRSRRKMKRTKLLRRRASSFSGRVREIWFSPPIRQQSDPGRCSLVVNIVTNRHLFFKTVALGQTAKK
jgi:hypothetical protein